MEAAGDGEFALAHLPQSNTKDTGEDRGCQAASRRMSIAPSIQATPAFHSCLVFSSPKPSFLPTSLSEVSREV